MEVFVLLVLVFFLGFFVRGCFSQRIYIHHQVEVHHIVHEQPDEGDWWKQGQPEGEEDAS